MTLPFALRIKPIDALGCAHPQRIRRGEIERLNAIAVKGPIHGKVCPMPFLIQGTESTVIGANPEYTRLVLTKAADRVRGQSKLGCVFHIFVCEAIPTDNPATRGRPNAIVPHKQIADKIAIGIPFPGWVADWQGGVLAVFR